MNTRGLVELVILNAGLDLGILSPALFAMMVLMALITTFMTTPILIAMKIKATQPAA
jgi:Kef-type K+ transport system membrane component KefB